MLSLVAVALLLLAGGPATGQHAPTPKPGGVLVTSALGAPPSLSPHEESTIATVQQASPCFNNLLAFDPAKKVEGVDTLIPELAEKWSWQDGYRNLVFFLRRDVKWHDGKPFTAADVTYTFDAVRGAPDARAKLTVVGPHALDRRRRVRAEGAVAGRLSRLAISLAVFGTNLLGDALRDTLDPRLHGS